MKPADALRHIQMKMIEKAIEAKGLVYFIVPHGDSYFGIGADSKGARYLEEGSGEFGGEYQKLEWLSAVELAQLAEAASKTASDELDAMNMAVIEFAPGSKRRLEQMVSYMQNEENNHRENESSYCLAASLGAIAVHQCFPSAKAKAANDRPGKSVLANP